MYKRPFVVIQVFVFYINAQIQKAWARNPHSWGGKEQVKLQNVKFETLIL